MRTAGPTYLLRSRHGIFYFRVKVPKISVDGRRVAGEVRLSLRTRCRRFALAQARELWVRFVRGVDSMRHSEATVKAPNGIQHSLIMDIGEAWQRLRDRGESLHPQYERTLAEKGPHAAYAHFAGLTEYDLEALDYYCRWKSWNDRTAAIAQGQINDQSAADTADDYDDHQCLDVLIDRFLSTKGNTKAAVRSYRTALAMFQKIVCEALGDPRPTIDKLEKEAVRHYASNLRKIPRHLRYHPISTVREATSSDLPCISVTTVNNQLSIVRQFLEWVEAQQYPIPPSLGKICSPIRGGIKGKRQPFTNAELRRLFESDEYQQGTFKRNSDYWVPLVGLFSGARQAEICQLLTEDIAFDAALGRWLLHFQHGEGKSFKTECSLRSIPLHDQLIELGIIDFVESRRRCSDRRLFPEEKRNEGHQEFRGFSARFSRYRDKLGIRSANKSMKDFHSFRHTVITKLTSQGVELYLAEWFVGHRASSNSQTVQTYSKGASPQALVKCLDYLNYDIDFKKIRKWNGA